MSSAILGRRTNIHEKDLPIFGTQAFQASDINSLDQFRISPSLKEEPKRPGKDSPQETEFLVRPKPWTKLGIGRSLRLRRL
jgi:hypothetical protein